MTIVLETTTTAVEAAEDARYRRTFGCRAGYLPSQRKELDRWLRDLKTDVANARANDTLPYSRSVAAMARLIETDGIARMYVQQMIDQVPLDHKTIDTIAEMLDSLAKISVTAPAYNPDPTKRVFFPMSSLFRYMMMTAGGEAAFRYPPFNDALRRVLQDWCTFLDSSASQYVLDTGEYGWLSPSAYEYNKLDEFVIPDPAAPHWGWASFNAYFHRQIKLDRRPVAEPDNPKVIVSANDGTVYRIAWDVKAQDIFWLKEQMYSLTDMLRNRYVERFVGGSVFQSFLSGADYHRWRAPIAGAVRYAEVVDGLMFSEAEAAGYDPTAGTYSQGYEASVNTRGLVFIESPDPAIGMVCVMPIGITEISSVTITVKAGDSIRKGDELGYFSYGGSSMVLVFQPGAIDHYTVREPKPDDDPDDGEPIKVNARIAVAK